MVDSDKLLSDENSYLSQMLADLQQRCASDQGSYADKRATDLMMSADDPDIEHEL